MPFFPPKRGVEFNLNPPKRGVEFNLNPPKPKRVVDFYCRFLPAKLRSRFLLPISSRQIEESISLPISSRQIVESIIFSCRFHDYSTISHPYIVISTGGTIGRACRIILYASISATHIISWGTPSHSRMN
jgi:hypothetical protein